MREKSRESISNYAASIILLSILFSGLSAGAWLLAISIYSQPQIQITFFGVIINLFLTVALIIVYVKISIDTNHQIKQMDKQLDSIGKQTEEMSRQADLQEQVTEIQERQQGLMEANFSPEVIIEGNFEAQDGQMMLELANKGTGLAKKLSLDFEFFVDDPEGNIRLVEMEDRIVEHEEYLGERRGEGIIRQGIKPLGGSLTKVATSDTPRVDAGAVLPPGETSTFETSVRFWYFAGPDAVPGEGRPISFDQGVDNLRKMEIEILAYRIYLTYQNILGEDHEPEKIAEGAVKLSDDIDLQGFLDARDGTAILEYEYPQRYEGLRAEFHLPF